MKPSSILRSLIALSGSGLFFFTQSQAATYYWDSNGSGTAGFGSANGIWGASTFWSTSSVGTGTTANTTITAADDINFGTAANAYTGTVTLSGDKTANSMTFGGSGGVTLIGDTASRSITLGNGGLTMASGTGAVTLGNGTATQNVTITLAAGAQTWTNNSTNHFTIANSAVASITRSAGSALTFNQTGSGVFALSTTHLSNDATGIIGNWTHFGIGTSQRYAYNNSGIIAGYAGGTVAAGAEDFTSATTNYDFDGTGTNTLTANRTANTVRYTGTGHTIDLGASGAHTLTLNGLLAVGSSGTLTIQRTGGTGTLAIGSANELVIAGPQAVTVSAQISGTAALTYAGTSTLTLSGANTYTGVTTIGSGTVKLGNATALGTSGAAASTKTIIASGATLDLNGQAISEGFESITGTGVGGNGALINSSGTAASITFAGMINNSPSVFSVGGSGNILLSGGVGSNSSTSMLTKDGSGTLTFGGSTDNNSLRVIVNSGTLVFNKTGSAAAVGGPNTSFVKSGATLQLGPNATDRQFWRQHSLVVEIGGVYDLNGRNHDWTHSGAGGVGKLNLNGTGIGGTGALINNAVTTSVLTLNTDGLVLQSNSSVGGTGNITIAGGSINGGFALTKIGAGILTLSNSNTYSGMTNVNVGTLLVNGSISTSSLTTVASGATIGGSGTIGALTISSGGFINPGNSPDTLDVVGAYTQLGTYNAEITANTVGNGTTGYDQISVAGSVDITGGSLNAMFSAGTYAANDLIFILLNDGSDTINGTYTGLAQGATVTNYGGYNWVISYTANSGGSPSFTGGNDIALMAIPEPKTALLGCLGVLLFLRRRR